jgi:hypothetical protein
VTAFAEQQPGRRVKQVLRARARPLAPAEVVPKVEGKIGAVNVKLN